MHLLPYAHCVATALVCTPPSSLPSCPMCCSQTENGNIRCSALKFNDSNKSTDPRQRLTRLLSVASLSRKHVRACQAFFFWSGRLLSPKVCMCMYFIAIHRYYSLHHFFFFVGFLSSTADAVLLERPCLSTAPFSSTAKLLERKRDDSFFFFFASVHQQLNSLALYRFSFPRTIQSTNRNQLRWQQT